MVRNPGLTHLNSSGWSDPPPANGVPTPGPSPPPPTPCDASRWYAHSSLQFHTHRVSRYTLLHAVLGCRTQACGGGRAASRQGPRQPDLDELECQRVLCRVREANRDALSPHTWPDARLFAQPATAAFIVLNHAENKQSRCAELSRLVLDLWDNSTGILYAGAMLYRRDFPATTRI